MYERVVDIRHLEESFKAVKRNRGSAGVDNTTISDYKINLKNNLEILQKKLIEEKYVPKPVKRVYIDKEDGSKRPLGIPTVEDRIVQQALKLVIEPSFESKFQNCSYGFRPKKNAHMAVAKVRKNLKFKYRYVIDADLKSYFDMIDHDLLMDELRKEISDESILNLVELTLKSGVVDNGCFYETQKGSTQGGVASPLFANVYLHPLDTLILERGHEMVRYADDFVVFHKSRKGAERVLKWITNFLEKKYKLKVHPDKTKIIDSYTEEFTFLGFVFRPSGYLGITGKRKKLFKEKVKEITRKNQTVNIAYLIKNRLNPYTRGWTNYYGIADIKTFLSDIMSWIRRRLRMVQMRSWKTTKKFYKAMRKGGWKGAIKPLDVRRWHNTLSTQAHMAMSNDWFEEKGLVNLISIYDDYHPQRG